MILERVESFISQFKKYFIKNKDGFYELPYLANSPESLIQGIRKMPFIKHAQKDKVFYSNTPFIKTEIHFQKLERGLWVIYAESQNKANLLFNRIVDKELLSDYFILGLEISTTQTTFKNSPSNKFSYSNYTCHLYKPESKAMHCRFKDTTVFTLNIFFDRTWLANVLHKESFFTNSNVSRFLESDTKELTWPVSQALMKPVYYPLTNNIKNKIEGTDPVILKEQTLAFIEWFIRLCDQGKSRESFFQLPDYDKKAILSAENYLTKNLNAPFPGINVLSRHVGISPTKLKNDFKMVFGETIFQYFRQKQMELAFHLIRYERKSVRDVARQMGYSNITKFFIAFKKHLGVLPTSIT
ncbi:MAG: helix-turn-helix domain-containing protein [Cytophagaceae bacterium]